MYVVGNCGQSFCFMCAEFYCLTLQVNQDYLQCEEFLVADIRVDRERHLIFASPEQLRLLKQTKRWFMDGTFRVKL